MVDELYVAWQDEVARSWHTIARLKKLSQGYELTFTKGAERLDEVTRKLFRLSPGVRYSFEHLIPFFKNKIPTKSRPDFIKMASWLGVSDVTDEFSLLAAFGLMPTSDSTLVYPAPKVTNNVYTISFFVHGIRHRHPLAIEMTEDAGEGTPLLPMLDVKNTFDENAIALRMPRSDMVIGFVPAFYAADLRSLLSVPHFAKQADIIVEKNNRDSPIQLRLFCKFKSPIPQDFKALDTDAHKIVIYTNKSDIALPDRTAHGHFSRN